MQIAFTIYIIPWQRLNVRSFSSIIILMSTIKYPNGTKHAQMGLTSDYHSGRGMRLENDLNDSNAYYRAVDRALIYKKPTPIQVVRVDYPSRNRAKIVEAYYRTPSTTDYNGVYRGRYIDFEAKETQNKKNFPLFMVHPHQIKHLKKVHIHGGIGFFLIRFTAYDCTYLVDSEILIHEIETMDRRSIPYTWFEQYGHPVHEGYQPRLDYLSIVDALYFKEEGHYEKTPK